MGINIIQYNIRYKLLFIVPKLESVKTFKRYKQKYALTSLFGPPGIYTVNHIKVAVHS